MSLCCWVSLDPLKSVALKCKYLIPERSWYSLLKAVICFSCITCIEAFNKCFLSILFHLCPSTCWMLHDFLYAFIFKLGCTFYTPIFSESIDFEPESCTLHWGIHGHLLPKLFSFKFQCNLIYLSLKIPFWLITLNIWRYNANSEPRQLHSSWII